MVLICFYLNELSCFVLVYVFQSVLDEPPRSDNAKTVLILVLMITYFIVILILLLYALCW